MSATLKTTKKPAQLPRCKVGRFLARNPYCKRCDKLIASRNQECRK
jgi:hypothetical protein